MALFFQELLIARLQIHQHQQQEMGTKSALYENLVGLTEKFGLALKTGNIETCHEIMRQGWKEKKKLSAKISTTEIETWCEKGMNAGAAACKIAGAGGGGFMFFMCDELHKPKIASALEGLIFLDVSIEKSGSQIIHVSA